MALVLENSGPGRIGPGPSLLQKLEHAFTKPLIAQYNLKVGCLGNPFEDY